MFVFNEKARFIIHAKPYLWDWENQCTHYSMKKFAAYILIVLPSLVFGQLLPKVPDFKGDIESITEKRYGKEVSSSKQDSTIFKPRKFSGWEYEYLFDANSKLKKRTVKINGVVSSDYVYERNQVGNRIIEREIVQDYLHDKKGDYIEYESFVNNNEQVEKVNFWSFDAQKNALELFVVEENAVYDKNKLTEFIRYNVKENGDYDNGEKCRLFYDNYSRIMRIEREDISTKLKTILYYYYNKKGFISQFSIDYLVGLRNNQNNQKQNIYYKYDQHGNWIKRYYWISDTRKRMEDRRKINYR